MSDPNYGTDLALGPGGFTAPMPTATGRPNLLMAVYRRCTTDDQSTPGRNIYGGKCVDVRKWFAKAMGPGAATDLGQRLVRACQAETRVNSAEARTRFDFTAKKLIAQLNVTPSQGPAFALVLATDGVTVEILNDLVG